MKCPLNILRIIAVRCSKIYFLMVELRDKSDAGQGHSKNEWSNLKQFEFRTSRTRSKDCTFSPKDYPCWESLEPFVCQNKGYLCNSVLARICSNYIEGTAIFTLTQWFDYYFHIDCLSLLHGYTTFSPLLIVISGCDKGCDKSCNAIELSINFLNRISARHSA